MMATAESRILDADRTEKKASRSGPRLPAGSKQMLVIMDETVIKAVKIAALEDDMKMSKAVETAVNEWLARRAAGRRKD